jgi:hypothetical protein
MENKIKTTDLKIDDVPQATAPINKIEKFALTFDWNEQNNQLLNSNLESDFQTLDIGVLRCILYIEQRRWNHFGRPFDSKTENRLRDLIQVIREKILSR